MSKNALAHFTAMARVGNVSKAAENLLISRQALSESVRSLESELGVALFTRGKSGVQLTRAGKALSDYVQETQRLESQMMERISVEKNRHAIRLATHLMHMQDEYFDRILIYQRDHPDIDVEFVDMEDYSASWNDLKNRSVDMVRTCRHPGNIKGLS